MSGVVDVGDAIELTFATTTGAAVAVSWFDPDGATVLDNVSVPESPAGSGQFPKTFAPTSPGIWQALFTASGAATAVERYYVRAYSVTGAPPLATVGEVAAQFGTLTAAQEGLASWLLRAASKMVRARFPLLDTQLADGRLDPELVALVVVNMVLRVLRNPQGLRSETVGPFSRSYDTTVAAGLLALAKDEIELLVPVVTGSKRYGIGTIMLRPGLAPPPCGIRRNWIR
jgi:hypothetical protein